MARALQEARKGFHSGSDYRYDALGRPLDLPPLFVPGTVTVDAVRDRLVWSDGYKSLTGRPPYRERQLPYTLLDQFLGLADKPSRTIRDFGRRWGVLRLCAEHGLPLGHNAPRGGQALGLTPCGVAATDRAHILRMGLPVAPLDGSGDYHYTEEPVERWREFSRLAFAMVSLGSDLHWGRRGRAEDWATLDQLRPLTDDPAGPDAPASGPHLLAASVDTWLRWSGIGPQFVWEGGEPVLRYRPPERQGLFATLALHLATALTATRGGLARCDGCGIFYLAARKPAAGRHHYCPDCGKGVADRDAKRRERERRRRDAAPADGPNHTGPDHAAP
jgi:predicted RNA-binding Zn-ribbon protein involved in translation (DUF1610 family)